MGAKQACVSPLRLVDTLNRVLDLQNTFWGRLDMFWGRFVSFYHFSEKDFFKDTKPVAAAVFPGGARAALWAARGGMLRGGPRGCWGYSYGVWAPHWRGR